MNSRVYRGEQPIEQWLASWEAGVRRWSRAPRSLFCGFCKRREIAKGDPVLLITIGTSSRELRRCVDCSGPAPPDLPPLVEQKQPGDFSMVSFGSITPKTRGDFKAQVREWMPYREPGEDDE